MFRPATITHPVVVNDGKPFEALGAFISRFDADRELDIRGAGGRAGIFSICRLFFKTDEEMRIAETLIKWQLAQALNPPIEVTDAVLKAMEKVPEAKFSLITKQFAGRAGTLPIYWEKQEKRWFAINGNFAIVVGDYVQADCPLALQVLLGFKTEGVPKND
jgi:hypothetical protein